MLYTVIITYKKMWVRDTQSLGGSGRRVREEESYTSKVMEVLDGSGDQERGWMGAAR